MMAAPPNSSMRMIAPNHFGDGLGFFLGGGWYRRRLDFDLGTRARIPSVRHEAESVLGVALHRGAGERQGVVLALRPRLDEVVPVGGGRVAGLAHRVDPARGVDVGEVDDVPP